MSETRALTAALSGPAFDGAASRSALHTSERHAERYAPEGAGGRQEGGLRSLAFADRVASPWMSAASQSRATQMFSSYATGTGERSAPGVSWLFPRPWFQDELDWMAASRQGLEATPARRGGSLSTRGTYIDSSSSGQSPTAFETDRGQAWSNVAMPVLSPDVLATVAPSMRGSAGHRSLDLSAPMQRNLRAWSPTVDFAAAAAAEVVMGAMQSVTAAGLPSIAERSPIWSGLAVVTPNSIASDSPSGAFAGPRAAMSAREPAWASPSSMMTPPTVASQIGGGASTAVESARDSISRIEHHIEELRNPTLAGSTLAGSTLAGSGGAEAPTVAVAPPISASEQQLATAARGSSAVAQALRTVELLLGAAAPSRLPSTAGSSEAMASSGAVSYDAAGAPIESAAPSSISAGAMPQHFAPSAGPRVAMPAGLGGLVTSLETSRTVARPMSRANLDESMLASSPRFGSPLVGAGPSFPGAGSLGAGSLGGASLGGAGGDVQVSPAAARGAAFAPIWAQAPSAFASVANHGARAIDHLSWSDRWLARFAGASPLALSAFDATRAVSEPTLRQLAVGSPEVVYIQPQLTARAVSSAGREQRAFDPRATDPRAILARPSTPTGMLRIDDGESVSDDIFAAIAAASVPSAPRAAQRPAAGPLAGAASGSPAELARVAELSEAIASARDARGAQAAAAAAASPSVMAPVDLLRASGRASVADLVSIAVPAAPDAGLSAGLASSPMAPALSSLMPLPTAPVFDPRALQGSGLADAYLGGFLARAALPVGVIAGAPTAAALVAAGTPMIGASASAMEAWTQRDLALAPASMRLASSAPNREFVATGGDVDVTMRAGRGAAGLFAPSAAPRSVVATAARAESTAGLLSSEAGLLSSEAGPAGARVLDEGALAMVGAESGAVAGAPARAALETELVALRAALLAGPEASSVPLAHATHAPLMASMATVPSATHAQIPALGGVVQGSSSPMATALARTAMATFAEPGAVGMPASSAGSAGTAFGAAAPTHAPTIAAAGGRPGSLAEAALAWSISEERAAANLAFDFVTPELILAARVYGLPPGAAAEAMRIASAGPSAMSSLATSLDLTFLRAFQSAPRGAGGGQTGQPGADPSMPPVGAQFAASDRRPGGPSMAADSSPSAAGISQAESTGSAAAAGTAAASVTAGATASAIAAEAASPAMLASMGTAAGEAGWSPDTDTLGLPDFAPSSPNAPARLPRGAFLWPAGSVAAMGLRALSADGYGGLPVVALELLAAQAVAELGTWVTAFPGAKAPGTQAPGTQALGTYVSGPQASGTPGAQAPGAQPPGGRAGGISTSAGEPESWLADGLPFVTASGAVVTVDRAGRIIPSAAALASGARSPSRSGAVSWGADDDGTDAPAEAANAATWFAASLGGGGAPARTRFESVYIALAQSPEGQSLSPSARAARAMSLLARSEDSQKLSTRERAQAAWSMLPGVYSGGLDVVAPDRGPHGAAPGANEVLVDSRPGLSGLAARAGEALGSFVNPSVDAVRGLSQSSDSPSTSSAAARAAAPIYVENNQRAAESAQSMTAPRAGRTFSQVGGGETEIPSWFEDAARRMFDGGGGSANANAGMSLAQMVLVTAMPTQQVAAATKGATSGGAGATPAAVGAKGGGGVDKPDVDQLALEVFHEVLKLIEIARERSGDPFQ